VRVDEEARRTVVFIGHETSGSFLPVGTGFLAGVRYKSTDFVFVVTADHVIDLIPEDTISIRMNRKAGDASAIKISKSTKIPSLDPNADLALFPLPPSHDIYDHSVVLLDREEYRKIVEEIWTPKLGEEIAVVGLYASHYGSVKNIPVVRVGHIAMMPDEPVLTQRGCYLRAYLMEVHSIIGLSGSPVYFNVPPTRIKEGKPQYLEGRTAFCMGVMLGYHLVSSAEDQIITPRHQGGSVTSEYSLEERNTGFAVVVPIEKLFDLVETREMKKLFDEEIGRRNKGRQHA
jgi:hypothetical protein